MTDLNEPGSAEVGINTSLGVKRGVTPVGETVLEIKHVKRGDSAEAVFRK